MNCLYRKEEYRNKKNRRRRRRKEYSSLHRLAFTWMTMANEGTASAGSHPPLVSPLRRLSICRQLSDVLKYRRKSCCSNSSDHLTNIPTPSPTGTTNSASSTFTFVWNCALTEVDSPPGSSSNEDLHVLPVQYPQRVRKNGLSDDPHVVNVKEITGSMVAACLIKQKSVSCDDVAFLSSSGDEQTICPNGSTATALIAHKAKTTGLSPFSFTFSFPFSFRLKEQKSLEFFLFTPLCLLHSFRKGTWISLVFTHEPSSPGQNIRRQGTLWETKFNGIGGFNHRKFTAIARCTQKKQGQRKRCHWVASQRSSAVVVVMNQYLTGYVTASKQRQSRSDDGRNTCLSLVASGRRQPRKPSSTLIIVYDWYHIVSSSLLPVKTKQKESKERGRENLTTASHHPRQQREAREWERKRQSLVSIFLEMHTSWIRFFLFDNLH